MHASLYEQQIRKAWEATDQAAKRAIHADRSILGSNKPTIVQGARLSVDSLQEILIVLQAARAPRDLQQRVFEHVGEHRMAAEVVGATCLNHVVMFDARVGNGGYRPALGGEAEFDFEESDILQEAAVIAYPSRIWQNDIDQLMHRGWTGGIAHVGYYVVQSNEQSSRQFIPPPLSYRPLRQT